VRVVILDWLPVDGELQLGSGSPLSWTVVVREPLRPLLRSEVAVRIMIDTDQGVVEQFGRGVITSVIQEDSQPAWTTTIRGSEPLRISPWVYDD
jgi:hypothetical protein